MKRVKLFVMDVDGTMTDGKIYMGSEGEVLKAFNVKDGYGIHEILPRYGVRTAIITGRKSPIVENRARELDIDFVFQGIKEKETCIKELAKKIGINLGSILFMGDDVMDLGAMNICGLSACPYDASEEIKNAVDYVCKNLGGNGAIRECINWLLKNGYMEE